MLILLPCFALPANRVFRKSCCSCDLQTALLMEVQWTRDAPIDLPSVYATTTSTSTTSTTSTYYFYYYYYYYYYFYYFYYLDVL